MVVQLKCKSHFLTAIRNVILPYNIIKMIKAKIINNNIILINIEIIKHLNIILFIDITSLLYVMEMTTTLLNYTNYLEAY